MRRVIITIACVVAAIALPAVAGAGSGATHEYETWTNELQTSLFYNGAFCTGVTVAGHATESGWARITETPNGGSHVTGQASGTLPLYEATGPPWDATLGAFVGTFTYRVSFDEQLAPGGQGSFGSANGGTLVYADGSSQHFGIVFRLVEQPDGPPKLFLVKIICGG